MYIYISKIRIILRSNSLIQKVSSNGYTGPARVHTEQPPRGRHWIMISLGAQALLVPGCEVCADASALHGCGMAMTGLDDQQCSDTLFRVLWDACVPCPFSLQETHQGCGCPFRGVVCCCCFLGVCFFDRVYRMPNAMGKDGRSVRWKQG